MKENILVIHYLDEFAGGDTTNTSMETFIFLEYLLSKCGKEEYFHKAVPPTTRKILRIVLDTVEVASEIHMFRLNKIFNIEKE